MVCELCSLNPVDPIGGMGGSLASSSRNKTLPKLMNVPAFSWMVMRHTFRGLPGARFQTVSLNRAWLQ
jgi:hypothetical protein